MHRSTALALVLALSLQAPAMAAPALSDYEIGLLRGINSFGSPMLDAPMAVLSNPAFVILAPMALGAAANPDSVSTPMLMLASDAIAYGANVALKPIFQRPRPYVSYPDLRTPNGQETGDPYSFPSGHAMVSMAAATVLADRYPSYTLPAYGLAALICYSRMYNGVHYPSDILAGAVLGYGIGKLTRWGASQLGGKSGGLQFEPTYSLGDGLSIGVNGQF